MPRLKLPRAGALGAALTVWDLYRRLPKRQRRYIARQVRTHGPRLAKQVVAARKKR